mmetsp:Transcript_67996/g.141780  ORF Transcript_67996/g.141780 Transcript_67996/m.141780 type:complete len:111 (+) Transcript_67996:78-410(+)
MKLFYQSMLAHGLYLGILLFICIHNGSCYYFDVFSRKYIQSVMEAAREEEREEREKSFHDLQTALDEAQGEGGVPQEHEQERKENAKTSKGGSDVDHAHQQHDITAGQAN